jgi:hypothetical protein
MQETIGCSRSGGVLSLIVVSVTIAQDQVLCLKLNWSTSSPQLPIAKPDTPGSAGS